MSQIPSAPIQKQRWCAASELLDDPLNFNRSRTVRIVLPIPMAGSAGLWGPSCIASAQLACHELNGSRGIAGKSVELFVLDASAEYISHSRRELDSLIRLNAIDAVVGMHVSAVREQFVKTIAGRVPYIYTPLYEGGEQSAGVYAIGDTPQKQLAPAIDVLSKSRKIKKWGFVGNDYSWPRISHEFAKYRIADWGASLEFEDYHRFGSDRLEETIQKIRSRNVDGVLVSLIGQDAVDFNRLFGDAELHRNTIRLSCAIEENGLLATGSKNSDRLFCVSSYFGSLNTHENACFREKYHNLHGDRAPTLNGLGQSTYEGIHFLASLMRDGFEDWRHRNRRNENQIAYASVRRSIYLSNSRNTAPMYLARANGLIFDDLQRVH